VYDAATFPLEVAMQVEMEATSPKNRIVNKFKLPVIFMAGTIFISLAIK